MVGRGNDVIDLLPPYSSKTSRATVITSANVDRFSKFCHWQILTEPPYVSTWTTLLHYLAKFEHWKQLSCRCTNTSTKKSVLHDTQQNLTKFGVCIPENITGVVYLISMIYRMQTA